MIDINLLRNDPDLIRDLLKNRQQDPSLADKVLKINQNSRKLLSEVEDLRSQQNTLNRTFSGKPSPKQLKEASSLKKKLKKIEEELIKSQEEESKLLETIPNIPAKDVPVGKDDNDNPVVKTVGKIPKFNFEVLDHVDLGEKLDIIDVKKAGQISGSRSGFYKKEAAVLEMALMNYAFSKLVSKGFIAMIPPVMVKSEVEWKCGYASNKNLFNAYYSIPEDDLIFVSSSEHSVIPYHLNEILDSKNLPLRYVNFSPCFRREAGTYGKDTRGMLRVHFFNKVEMNLFTLPDYKISDQACLDMLVLQEELMQELKIPYQVVQACTGDLPQPNRRMYDINAWFPGQNKYRETHSCSNCGDYQARRLNTKVKVDGKNQLVHTLNATMVTDRVLLAILENYQQKDGSIAIPKVLQKYTNFKIIKPIKN